MILIVLLSVALGGLLVWALYAEPAPPRPQPVAQPIGAWSTGADLRRHGFPIVLAGYDPAAVDANLARIAAVHDELRRQAAGATGADGGGATRDLTAQQSLGGTPPPPRSVLDG